MNYIFFDLELNQAYFDKNRRSNVKNEYKKYLNLYRQEIIEIGAVKTNEKLEYIDKFSMFIKPKILFDVNPHVSKLTGITMRELRYGVDFTKAIESFKNFIGEEYLLLSWGGDDEICLRENMTLHNLDSSWLNNNCMDAQKIYMKAIDINNSEQISLEIAINDLGVEKNKEIHRAYNDAFYTYKVYEKLNTQYDIDYIKSTIIKQKEQHQNLIHSKKINKIQNCPKCGKFMKVKIQPFILGRKFAIISNCDMCNVYCLKYISWSYDKDSNIVIDGDYQIRRLAPSKYIFYRDKILHKKAK